MDAFLHNKNSFERYIFSFCAISCDSSSILNKGFDNSDTLFYETLEFTCGVDADCNYGYCEDRKCVCLDDYNLKKDCSLKGCEFAF